MKPHSKKLVIFFTLMFLMLITRFNHFGSSTSFPDASLAVFLLGGFFISRLAKLSLAAFTLLLLEAGAIDYYATQFAGVSDWCITPAYWFLIPTYASMWFSGHWFATRQQSNMTSLALFGGVAWLSTSIAFLISNGAFYLFSGKFTEMSIAEYATSVAKYYPPYVSGSLMYLALAAIIYVVIIHFQNSSTNAAHQ